MRTLLAFLLLVSSVEAQVTTRVSFTGSVWAFTSNVAASPSVNVGDSITGEMRFDPAAGIPFSIGAGSTIYNFVGANLEFEVATPAYSWMLQGGQVRVEDDWDDGSNGVRDRLWINATSTVCTSMFDNDLVCGGGGFSTMVIEMLDDTNPFELLTATDFPTLSTDLEWANGTTLGGEIESVDTAGGSWKVLFTIDHLLLSSAEHEVYCPGDSQHPVGCAACPCANDPPPMENGGCLNAMGLSAELRGVGTAQVTSDDLRFLAERLNPAAITILASADLRLPRNPSHPCFGEDTGAFSAAFNGKRCIGQNLQRYALRTVDNAGRIGITNEGWGPGLLSDTAMAAGQTRQFQLFYTEPTGAVCGASLNTTNAVSVTALP